MRLTWTVLADHGHDVDTVLEEGLGGRSDDVVSVAAIAVGRCLVTFDVDFADERAHPPGTHPGILILRLRSQDRDAVVSVVERLMSGHDIESFAGALVVVTESTVRVRRPSR